MADSLVKQQQQQRMQACTNNSGVGPLRHKLQIYISTQIFTLSQYIKVYLMKKMTNLI